MKRLQPSQLYINENKLIEILKLISSANISTLDPIPIKKLDQDIIITDGHTRVLALYKLNRKKVLVEWETENLSWIEYRECVNWCKNEEINSIADLENRIVSDEDYKIKWLKRCEDSRLALNTNS